MNHYTWTYVAGGGRNIPIGLYHSSKKGHLVIYVGKKITTIDFNVLDTKEYTFFIDSELCRIKLERRNDEMYYFFEIDKKADTPMNRARWAMERKFLKQMLLGIAGFVVVIVLFSTFLSNKKKPNIAEASTLLNSRGVETLGRVTIEMGDQQPHVSYHFIAGNQDVSAEPNMQTMPSVILESGMPLESGDEFTVRYIASNPSVNQIDFDRPSKRQLTVYQERAVEKYATLHPEEAVPLIKCMVQTAYQMEGLAGLAKFYFQNIPPSENPNHNQDSFFRLIRSLEFQKLVEQNCW